MTSESNVADDDDRSICDVNELSGVRDDYPDPLAVLAAFGLPGRPIDLTPAPGGWSNSVYRLRTDHGDYAVKALRNPWGEPRWQQWLEESWRLEIAAGAAEVAMPRPIAEPVRGGCVAFVDRADGSGGLPVRIHHWVDGTPLASGPVDLEVAAWAGRTLARVHGLGLKPLDPELFRVAGSASAQAWPDLVERARSAGTGWAALLAAANPWVERMTDLFVAVRDESTVMSHGDVGQRNVLVTAAGPLLCDWDVAMPVVPAHDLAHVAVSLAAWRDKAVARTVVRAYADWLS